MICESNVFHWCTFVTHSGDERAVVPVLVVDAVVSLFWSYEVKGRRTTYCTWLHGRAFTFRTRSQLIFRPKNEKSNFKESSVDVQWSVMKMMISVAGPVVLRRHCSLYLISARSEIINWKRPEIKAETNEVQLTLLCSFKYFCCAFGKFRVKISAFIIRKYPDDIVPGYDAVWTHG